MVVALFGDNDNDVVDDAVSVRVPVLERVPVPLAEVPCDMYPETGSAISLLAEVGDRM